MIARLERRFGYRLRQRIRLIGLCLRGETILPRARELAFALTGGVVPLFQGGGPEITMTTTAAVTAGRICEVSGDRSVRHGQAASLKCIGVAKQTADAIGDKVGIASSGVWMLRAQGAISAGDQVIVSAGNDGRVATLAAAAGNTAADINNARAVLGRALAAIGDGTDGPVLVKLG